MQFSYASFCAHLNKTPLALYLICSDAPVLLDEAVDALHSAGKKQGYLAREIFYADAQFSWVTWEVAWESPSLLSPKKWMELRLSTAKFGKEGGQILEKFLQKLTKPANSPPDCIAVIRSPCLDAATQKTAWYEMLLQSPQAGYVLRPKITPSQFPAWIQQRLAAHGLEADPTALRALVTRVENNLVAAKQAIEKLALLYPPGKLSLAQITATVEMQAHYEISQLGEALLGADLVRWVHLVDTLHAQGVALPWMLAFIAHECRSLLKVLAGQAAGKPWAELMKEQRIWGPRATQMFSATQKISPAKAVEILHAIAAIDALAKGVPAEKTACFWTGEPPANAWDALKELGKNFVTPARLALQ